MDWIKFFCFNLVLFVSAVVGKSLHQNELLVFRITIPIMTGCLISAYGKWAKGLYWIVFLEVALFVCNLLGRLVFERTEIPIIFMYIIGEAIISNIIAVSLLSIWTRSRRKAGLSLNEPVLLDETSVVIPFLVLALSLTAVVGIIGAAILNNISVDFFLDFFASESVGTIRSFVYDDHQLALMLLLVYLSMLPFTVVLAERNRILESVEKQVDDRTADLVKAIQEKGEFMSFLCHELRNPLHVVLSMSDMAMLDNPNNEYAKASITAARYMTDLCNDVLDATKLQSGKTNIEPQWGDLVTTLGDLCHAMSLHATTLGIRLQYHPDSDVPDRVFADSLRWRQCLTNLLANSCRFTKRGGRIDVYLHLLKDGSLPLDHVRLRCEVTDTGIGIDPSHIPTLFIPFSIASQKTAREYQGSGLGLSLSYMLVDLMGGKLSVESQLGDGSRFWFELVVPTEKSSHLVNVDHDVGDADLDATTMVDIEMVELTSSAVIARNDSSGARHERPRKTIANGHWTRKLVSPDANAIEEEEPRRYYRRNDDNRTTRPSNALTTTAGPAVIEEKDIIVSESTTLLPSTIQPHQPTTSLALPYILQSTLPDRHLENSSSALATHSRILENIAMNDYDKAQTTAASDTTDDPIVGFLVVDDSDVNRALLKRMLNRLEPRMKLHMACDGQEAIDLAEKYQYRVIFMDLQMPRVDGWQAIAHIGKAGLNISTPIVITTANAVTLEERSLGQCQVLCKPFLSKDLKAILDSLHSVDNTLKK
ncbi:hypothetical protein SmJEL517_g02344 [Synchytrium microbalum]|uniref:histidine kinase n=1 Tax=Synchytrium microbalum TaxID=1806994 RepID=A0A507C108_9FUNG|nr:uncharacterized protein SmJEL517_g02344 [Synchytrium microbalum]TPX35210.1 hypothetical protein SmJEL517_g02344 [Synchytrium microbalum]